MVSAHDLTQHILEPRQLPLLLLDGGAVLHIPRCQHSEVVLQLLSVELVRSTHLFELLLQFLYVALQPHLPSNKRQLRAQQFARVLLRHCLYLERRVIFCVVQAQRGQVVLLIFNALLALFKMSLFHLSEQIQQFLHLRPVLAQKFPPLLRRDTLDFVQVLVEALLHLVVSDMFLEHVDQNMTASSIEYIINRK
jgi:hypothetical protein